MKRNLIFVVIGAILIVVVAVIVLAGSSAPANVATAALPTEVGGTKIVPTATAQPTAQPTIVPPTPTAAPSPTADTTTNIPNTAAPPTATPLPPTPTPTPAPAGIIPTRVKIPSIGVDAKIEQVGLDKTGAMSAPQDFFEAAWYKLGYKPGQIGNAVLAGHVDSAVYGKALFWDLRTLKPGSRIFLQDASGKELQFEVYDMQFYPFDSAPLEQIFGISNDVNLNIITCGGTFDQKTHNYDKRLVVYTKLVA